MENAVDALKLAFAVIIFVIALSLVVVTFSQTMTVADIVFYASDKTKYYEYEEGKSNFENRIVGIESIIPTCYRAKTENLQVKIDIVDKTIEITTNKITVIDNKGTIEKDINIISQANFDPGLNIVLNDYFSKLTSEKFIETYRTESKDEYKEGTNGEKVIIKRGVTTTYITYTKQIV